MSPPACGIRPGIISSKWACTTARHITPSVLFSSPVGHTGYVAFSNILDDLGMPTTNVPKVGWHRYSVDVTPTAALFKLDLNADGIINATLNVPLTLQPAGFNNVRMGGPSGVSSTAGVRELRQRSRRISGSRAGLVPLDRAGNARPGSCFTTPPILSSITRGLPKYTAAADSLRGGRLYALVESTLFDSPALLGDFLAIPRRRGDPLQAWIRLGIQI